MVSEQLPYTSTQEDPALNKRVCLVQFAYHLWHIDAAARAFPRNLDHPDDIGLMKKRWEIGLVLEIVSRPLLRSLE